MDKECKEYLPIMETLPNRKENTILTESAFPPLCAFPKHLLLSFHSLTYVSEN
jgi:hypothetical protein